MNKPLSVEDGMSDEQAVLQVYADAVWIPQYGAIYDDSDTSRERLSGGTWWNIESAAWADARSKLPQPAVPVESPEEFPPLHFAMNLLASMHGDGGHYVSKHGFKKACVDAQTKYYELLANIDSLEFPAVPVEERTLAQILGVGQKFPDEQQHAIDLVKMHIATGEHQGEGAEYLYMLDVIVNLLRIPEERTATQRKVPTVEYPTREQCYERAIGLIHKLRPAGCFGDEEGYYGDLEFYVMALRASIPEERTAEMGKCDRAEILVARFKNCGYLTDAGIKFVGPHIRIALDMEVEAGGPFVVDHIDGTAKAEEVQE